MGHLATPPLVLHRADAGLVVVAMKDPFSLATSHLHFPDVRASQRSRSSSSALATAADRRRHHRKNRASSKARGCR